jgi:4-hydroxy-tetrahydrodipicolinate reductase
LKRGDMVKAIVTGAVGRMGNRIINIINETDGIELVGATEKRGSKFIGMDSGELAGIGKNNITISDDITVIAKDCDVIIDFTSPASSLEHLYSAAEEKRAIVIGTTGFSDEQLKKIKGLSREIRCVLSPNMSVGVNVMFKMIRDMAKILGSEYDIEIIEAHHRLKKDAPSGTAMKMAEIVADSVKRDLSKVGVYSRKGIIGERKREEIGIQTIRAGDIVGEHTVMFGGLGERLEITHKAQSRDNFARGAVKAAMWIVDRPPGIYDMEDVLGLR